MAPPSPTPLFVWTKPEHVRSKQPVDLYVSFCITIKRNQKTLLIKISIRFEKSKKKKEGKIFQ
jgi:hypothetical protein